MGFLSLFGQVTGDQYGPYTTYASNTTTLSGEQQAKVVLVMLLISLASALIMYLVTAWSLSRIFKKVGLERKKAWIPVYNIWLMLKLGGQKGFWAILVLFPIVNLVALIFIYIAMYHIGLKFGKPKAFVLVGIFFHLIWYIWLAVDHSTWQGDTKHIKPSRKNKKPHFKR